MQRTPSIPRPLVRTNQWVIVLSVIAAWVTGFYWILALPLLAGLIGLATGFNPIMRFAKLFLRKPGNEYAQEDRDQQQFNQVIAVSCLVLGLAGFVFQWQWAAYVFSAMVSVSAFVAICGFCIGCFIRFQWTQYRYRRSVRNAETH